MLCSRKIESYTHIVRAGSHVSRILTELRSLVSGESEPPLAASNQETGAWAATSTYITFVLLSSQRREKYRRCSFFLIKSASPRISNIVASDVIHFPPVE